MILRSGVLLAIVVLAAVVPTLAVVPRRCGAALLALFSLWWLQLDSTMEGGVLLTLSDGHGFTVADVISVGGLVAAAFAWLRRAN